MSLVSCIISNPIELFYIGPFKVSSTDPPVFWLQGFGHKAGMSPCIQSPTLQKKKRLGHRISGVRRNYVTWPVFFSIQRQMKEDHDVSSEDDQMTLGGAYRRTAPFITVDID